MVSKSDLTDALKEFESARDLAFNEMAKWRELNDNYVAAIVLLTKSSGDWFKANEAFEAHAETLRLKRKAAHDEMLHRQEHYLDLIEEYRNQLKR